MIRFCADPAAPMGPERPGEDELARKLAATARSAGLSPDPA